MLFLTVDWYNICYHQLTLQVELGKTKVELADDRPPGWAPHQEKPIKKKKYLNNMPEPITFHVRVVYSQLHLRYNFPSTIGGVHIYIYICPFGAGEAFSCSIPPNPNKFCSHTASQWFFSFLAKLCFFLTWKIQFGPISCELLISQVCHILRKKKILELP
jgi:hypothetical protein